MAASFDRADILRTAQIFHEPGDVIELRIPKAGKFCTISGYFDNTGNFADSVVALADDFGGYYFTINQVNPDLLARAANKYEKYAKFTTADGDIIRRRWLLIDLDPDRPAGISSSNEEHDAALQRGRDIREWLISKGWPANAFVLADSGNGAHLVAKIDLPNDDSSRELVNSCLEALDFVFSTEAVKVDLTPFNAARIWKVYGTMARKGSDMPDRPHRLARLLDVPESLETITKEQLEALAAILPKVEPTKGGNNGQHFDPAKYAQEHGAKVVRTKAWQRWELAILEECPFDKSHNRGEAYIGVHKSGARKFGCFHDSCQGNHWKELRAKWGASEGEKSEDCCRTSTIICREDLTKEDKKGNATLSPSKAVKAVMRAFKLAMTQDRKEIYRYDANLGIYKTDGERFVNHMLDNVAGDLANLYQKREVADKLKNCLLLNPVVFDADPYLFPARDGVIDLRTGESRDPKPEDYLTFQYNSSLHDEKADFRQFLWFLSTSLPDPRDVLTVLDIITAIAIRIPFEVIVLLFGGGSNGKGILEKVILALFTMSRAAAVRLEEMSKSRFGEGAILGKDVWIVTEVETVKDAMTALKKISTGEFIDTDIKYGERKQGKPHVVPILDANLAFDFGDDSYGRKRRILKIDFPYTFGDGPNMRPIDRHLEEKLTSPEVLAGITKIIAARAPRLIESRRIYRRKNLEEQEEEYKRQRFSPSYFCDECLDTSPANEPICFVKVNGEMQQRLTADKAYEEYREYCKLFNVTTPLEKNPFGKYIRERFSVVSAVSSEEGKNYRYYPGVYLTKSAITAFAEVKTSPNYSNYSTTTGELQEWIGKNDSSSEETTGTTGELLSEVVREVTSMYEYIKSCKEDECITYENYLKNAVVPVVAVVCDQQTAVSKLQEQLHEENAPVVEQEPPQAENVGDPKVPFEESYNKDRIAAEAEA